MKSMLKPHYSPLAFVANDGRLIVMGDDHEKFIETAEAYDFRSGKVNSFFTCLFVSLNKFRENG